MAEESDVTEAEADPTFDWRLLTIEEAEDLNDAESTVLPVTYSGQDFDVNGLVRRLNSDDILVPTFSAISLAGRQCELTLVCTPDEDVHLSDAGYALVGHLFFNAAGYSRLGG